MTKEETKQAIKVMQAYVDGKEIESCTHNILGSVYFPQWNWYNDPTAYRVKLNDSKQLARITEPNNETN